MKSFHIPSWGRMGRYVFPFLLVIGPGLRAEFSAGLQGWPTSAPPPPGPGFNQDWIVPALAGYLGVCASLTACRMLVSALGKRVGIGRNIDTFHRWLWPMPWRPLVAAWQQHVTAWFAEGDIGNKSSGSFASTLSTFTRLYKPGDFFIGIARVGRFAGHQPVGLRDPDKGIIVFAEPGAGKTLWLKTLLATHIGTCLFFDPDGSITACLRRRLGSGGDGIIPKRTKDGEFMRFVCLDPTGMTGMPSGEWNSLDEVTRAGERQGGDGIVRWCEKIAEAVVRQTDQHQAIFALVSRKFLCGLVLLVWLIFPEACDMITVNRLLTQGWIEGCPPDEDPGQALLDFMVHIDMEAIGKENPHGLFPNGTLPEEFGDIIRTAGSLMKSGQSRDGKNPFRTPAIEGMAIFNNPGIRRISRRSDFEMIEFRRNLNVGIVLPVGEMRGDFSTWCRLLSVLTFTTFENTAPKGSLFLYALEEAPAQALERLPVILSNCRKMLMRAAVINQDRGQIESLYGKDAETLISSSECEIYMATNHTFTLRYLAEKLGKATRTETVEGPWYAGKEPHFINMERGAATPDDLNRLLSPQRRNIIVKPSSGKAMILKQGRFFEVLPVTYFDPDPNFRETLARRITRRIMKWIYKADPPMKRGDALDLLGMDEPFGLSNIEVCYQTQVSRTRLNRSQKARLDEARSLLLREARKFESFT